MSIDVEVEEKIVEVSPVSQNVTVDVGDSSLVVIPMVEEVEVAVNNAPVIVEVGKNVQVASESFLQFGVAATALFPGQVVATDDTGEIAPAECEFALGLWEVVGVSAGDYKAGDIASINAYQGRSIPIKFITAPKATDNGRFCYLHAGGLVDIAPPEVVPENSIVVVGVIVGADGVTDTPNVILQIQHLDPDLQDRFALGFAAAGRIREGGVQSLGLGGVSTSLSQVTFDEDVVIDGTSIEVNEADLSDDYELQVIVLGVAVKTVPLQHGEVRNILRGTGTLVPAGSPIAIALIRTSGSGPSTFRATNAVVTYRTL